MNHLCKSNFKLDSSFYNHHDDIMVQIMRNINNIPTSNTNIVKCNDDFWFINVHRENYTYNLHIRCLNRENGFTVSNMM